MKKGGMMKKALFYVLAITAVMFITCGNEPPEEFYEGTPADDSAIVAVLDANTELLYTADIHNDSLIELSMALCKWLLGDQYKKFDDSIVKQQVDSLADTCTIFTRFRDLWYAKDTTCTVYLWDTFTVTLDYHWSNQYIGHYDLEEWEVDTFIDSSTVPWDTIYDSTLTGIKIGTVDTIWGTDSLGGFDAFTDITGEGLRHLFFEPEREWVEDPETGDSLWAVADPRVWHLKRISYGNYYFPNSGGEIPYIASVVIKSELESRWDTVYALNYDTLFTGHAMNRFRHVDSLLEYDDGDTLTIDIVNTSATIVDSFCLYFASMNGIKVQLNTTGQGKLPVTGDGITNLVFGVMHEDGLYYIQPRSPYAARYWLVPIRVR
jgi:hypothetical protein